MKFIHTSDIHYGASPDANRPWGKTRARAVRDTFENIISICGEEKADLLIISGGLFDGLPTIEEIESVNAAFSRIPDTKIYIIAGEDDPVFTSSPVITYRWAANVIYNTSAELNSVFVDNLDVEIFGISNERSGFDISKLARAEHNKDHASILVLSTSKTDEKDFPQSYTYIACGGDHHHAVKRGGSLVNSGSPEPLSAADTGRHGYYIGEIDTAERKITSLKFVTLPTVRYITLVVNVTPVSTRDDVLNNLTKEIESRGTDNIYRIRLNGLSNPEVTFNLEELENTYRIDEVCDLTRPDYDYVKLFREHPSDMVGFFVKEMNREDISELDRKALTYGVTALLKTADERS